MTSNSKTYSFLKKPLPLLIAAASLASAPLSAAVLEEVVVTAQKREQNLQDVSLSVTAFSGDQMKALGISETTEITQQVPNLQINAWSPNVTIFNLRGISQNNFGDYLEAPVAVYMDDAYIGSMNAISGQLFDVKRVEVLRGPQGTLFGRNATGGLIHYVSQDASDEEFNGYVEAGYASFDKKSVEFAVGGGLSDKVRGRIAGRWEESDGYIESTATRNPGGNVIFPGNGQDIGGSDGYAFRGTLQVDFTENLTGDFWIKYAEDNDVATGGYVFEACNFDNIGYCATDNAGRSLAKDGVIEGIFGSDADVHDNYSNNPGFLNRESASYQAKFEWAMDNGVDVTSITNYIDMNKDYEEDGDGTFVDIINFFNGVDFTQFSQELRFSGSTDTMRWQTGVYFLSMEVDGYITTEGNPVRAAALASFGSATLPQAQQTYVLDSKNWSVFGETEYDLSDALTLKVGLRWSQDDKQIDYQNQLTDVGQTPVIRATDESFAAAVPGSDDIDYGDWAGRLGLDWRITENTLVYASYNRGIKGGNWTLSADVEAEDFQHDEETLHSYEVGIKTDLLDGTLRLNTTAFYYDYEDYQAFSLAGGTPQVTNSDATAQGVEFEVFWMPNEHWDVIMGGSFMESEVDEVRAVGQIAGPDFTGGAVQNSGFCASDGAGGFLCDYPEDTISDAEFPNAPEFSFNYLVRYNFDALAGNIALQVDGTYYDDQFLEVTNAGGSMQEAYGVTNARVSWMNESENLQVSLWGKNITDEEFKVYGLDFGPLGTTSYYAPPATYGVNVKYDF